MAEPGDSPVKQDDFLAFLKQYAPERKRAGEKDVLAKRYRILPQPLPELSSSYARAYAARDEKAPEAQVYALVYETGVPLRQKNIQALKTYRHPSLVSLLAEGLVEISAVSGMRYVAVLEKPPGMSLAQSLAQRKEPVPASLIFQQFLRPLAEIISAFVKMGISHNRINPGNIYLANGAMVLGECVSEPSGFSQDYLFEPVERMLANPRAKADYAPGADCYAYAILAIYLALGFSPARQPDKETLIRDILNNGPYHTLAMPWELPLSLQDLLRGVLNDGRRERWEIPSIELWLAGRRFNLILPQVSRETSRGFEWGGMPYFNRRILAYAIGQHWNDARELLSDNRLGRWLTTQAHRQDIADALTRIFQPGAALTPKQEDDVLARVLILLDPAGPLRFRQISVAAEGIGPLLAHSVIAERHEDVRALQQMIEMELAGFWGEQQKANSEYAAFAKTLHKARAHLKMKGLGFGMERCLYDLNPSLPCLSPMLKGHTVLTLSDLLAALDIIAPQKALNEEVGDPHIAAFAANRLNIDRELRLDDLHSQPTLMRHSGLLMLKLLAQAQAKTKEGALQGLCHWFGARLFPLLSDMHSRARQKKLQASLREAANSGSLEHLAALLLSGEAFEADRRDFENALAHYAALNQSIATLRNKSGLAMYASLQGRGVAQNIAYSVCLATVYFTLKSCFHL